MMCSEKREGKRRRDCLVKMATEMTVTQPQAQQCLGPWHSCRAPTFSPCFLILKKKWESGKELFNFSFEKMNYIFSRLKHREGK